MDGIDGLGGLGPEDAVNGQHGYGGGELADDGDEILQSGYGHAGAPLLKGDAWGGALDLGKGLALTDQLRQLPYCPVKGHQLIPGALAHDAVGSKVEDALECLDRLLGPAAEDTVRRVDPGDGGVVAGDAVQHCLEYGDIAAGGALLKGVTGVGVLNISDGSVGHQLNVIAVVMAQDVHSPHALPGQRLAAPLGKAVAGDGGSIAELSGQRLHKALPANVGGEQFIHQIVYIFKGAAALDKLLVVHGGAGNIEVIAPAGVVFRVYPVKSKGNLGQDVGAEGGLRPGGVYLTGGHVFDVVGERHRHVFRPLAGWAGVNGDGLRYVGRD